MKKLYIIFLILLSGIATNAQCWSKISAYWYTSVGIKNDGTLWGWGSNGSGFFLTGDYVSRSTPTLIGTDANWMEVSVGSQHILALKTNGTLWAWGYNSFGQLGDGTNITRNSPTQIGTSTWLKISTGQNSSFAIRSDSTLWAWGGNSSGQLGVGNTTDQNVLTQIGVGSKWKSIAANYNHTLAIKADGTLWAWGENSFGQLGDGTNIQKSSPTQIGIGITWSRLSESAGVQFSLAIATNGTLWGWGNNSYGQLGNGTTGSGVRSNPTQIGTATDWQKVSTGSDHTLAIKTDGTLWAWGGNYRGQLGDGTTIQKTEPTRIGISTMWQKIAAGQGHSTGVLTDATNWAWGYNGFGELGIGSQVDIFFPVNVSCINVGLDNTELKNDVSVYPNPAAETLTITTDLNLIINKITITDLLGKIFLETNGNSNQIDVSMLDSGMYLLKMISEGNSRTIRFIKK